MKLTWKWTCSNVLLLAMIGCNSGDESAAPAPAGGGAPAPGVKSDPTERKGPPPQTAPDATKSDPSKKSDDAPKVEGPKADNPKSPGGASSLAAKELAGIKELPEAEQAVALKQLVCPVSGDSLGEMGKPVKVTYEGRSFYLCCKSCEPEVKADPKAFIAKLDKKDDKK
jgi:YHS domain-containing protein